MSRSALYGRRIHIAGSVDKDPAVARPEDVVPAREFVAELVAALVKRGANFVVPVDGDPTREDGLPICFDWLVWETISKSIMRRPPGTPGPLAVAVQHHKNEDQIPAKYVEMWDELRSTDHVRIENAAQWNMNAKRMETQARYGDILITLGGTEGAIYLANLYHDAGRPVIPLDAPIGPRDDGSRKLFDFGMASGNSRRLFQVADGGDSHGWMNRIRHLERHTTRQRVETLLDLLESLEPPSAFAVRLLNDEHPEYPAVQDFFDTIVAPVVEVEFGYRLTVVDGQQAYDHARIDQEIFARLHRAGMVVADITGSRPNCFLELGYALGRALPTIVTARAGSDTPFDITTFAGLRWKTGGTVEERRKALREHLQAVRNRPPLVSSEGLVP